MAALDAQKDKSLLGTEVVKGRVWEAGSCIARESYLTRPFRSNCNCYCYIWFATGV